MHNHHNHTTQENAALDWLFGLQRFGVQPGLGTIQSLLSALDHPEQQFKTVLVGGTNGKGSTANTLAHLLHWHGARVGLFTSPHLTHIGERFMVSAQNGLCPLSETLIEETLREIRPAAEQAQASFFEVVTALGCLLFAQQGVEIAIMEVGMGGRWDATNALDPILSVITGIDLDHTAVLGHTKEAIATEKAGILRPSVPAVTAAIEPHLLAILEKEGADLWAQDRDWQVSETTTETIKNADIWDGTCGILHLHGLHLHGREIRFRTALLGTHGLQNAALAVVAALRLGVNPKQIAEMTLPHWAGRLEVIEFNGTRFILDGAHNPAGANALLKALRRLGIERLPVIFGAAEDKDLDEMSRVLSSVSSRVILTKSVLSPRAASPEALASNFQEVSITQSPQAALDAVTGEPLVLICGSLYLIGEIRPLLTGEKSGSYERWQ